jgi:hypothetical protein
MSPSSGGLGSRFDALEVWGEAVSRRIDEQRDTIEGLSRTINELSGKIIRLETKLLFISGIFGFTAGFVPMIINYLIGKRGP